MSLEEGLIVFIQIVFCCFLSSGLSDISMALSEIASLLRTIRDQNEVKE